MSDAQIFMSSLVDAILSLERSLESSSRSLTESVNQQSHFQCSSALGRHVKTNQNYALRFPIAFTKATAKPETPL